MNRKAGIKKLLYSSVFTAFIINAAFLTAVILFCDMKYEVSDDFMTDAVLSGAFGGGYDAHLLFSNILLGYFLRFFYRLLPVVSWYFVFQIAVCFLSLWAVSFIVLERNRRAAGVLLCVLFVSFFSDDLYILVQFTKTAAAAACAGGALFLYGYRKRDQGKAHCMIPGGILALTGSMIRFSCIYIALAFLLLMFLRFVRDSFKTRGRGALPAEALNGLLCCALIAAAAFGLRSLNRAVWNSDPGYASYREYNSLRAAYTDTKSSGYEAAAEELTGLGLSEVDFLMLQSWNFLDRDYFTEDLIREAARVKQQYRGNSSPLLSALKQFWERGYQKYAPVWGIGLIFLLLALLHPGEVPRELPELMVCALLLFYFFMRGRVLYRVEYSIFFCTAVCLVTAFHVTETGGAPGVFFTGLAVLLCILKLPLYIPDTSYQTMTQEEYDSYIYDVLNASGKYDIRKYRCNVNAGTPYGDLTALIEADDDNYYLLDFNTAVQQVYFGYRPWIRVPGGLWENEYSYLGGVVSGFPGNEKVWAEHGIDTENPYKSLINDNIFVVDSKNSDTKLAYLREHYYPDAEKELVDTVDGMEIWKYYV